MNTKQQVWDRQPGESARAHAALIDYLHMGVARSLRALLERYVQQSSDNPQTKPPTLKWTTRSTWSDRFHWQRRAAAWDAYQHEQDEREWRERRREVAEADWEQGGKLRELAAQILAQGDNFLETRRRFIKGTGGEPDKEIITVKLKMELAVKALETASKLQRLASGLETERRMIDFGGMSDEEVIDYAQKLATELGTSLSSLAGDGAAGTHSANGATRATHT